MPRSHRRPAGFTLIELLVSLAILAVLAVLVLPVAQLEVQRMREKDLRLALREIRSGIDAYKQASADGHIVVKNGESGYPHTLLDLTSGIRDELNPAGPRQYFLRRLPRDPFFADPTVSADKTWGKRRYDSEPEAPQEGSDVFDVYSLSAQTGLNGVPYAKW